MERYRLVRRLAARRWHVQGDHERALCGVAMAGADIRTTATSDLRTISCPDCLAILTGKRNGAPTP